MQKLIYIASPYSHSESKVRDENYIKVAKFAAELCAEGKVAISPIVYGHTLASLKEMRTDWEFWMDFCFSLLDRCEGLIVYKMDGWDKSRGVTAEIEFAEKKGIEISYVEYKE